MDESAIRGSPDIARKNSVPKKGGWENSPNILFSETMVAGGTAIAVVIRTGKFSSMGNIKPFTITDDKVPQL